MPAPVINGLFSTTFMLWPDITVGQPSTLYAIVANPQQGTVVLQDPMQISGPDASVFSLPAGQTPVTLQPDQSVLVKVTHSGVAGARIATLTLTFVGSGAQAPTTFIDVALKLPNSLAGFSGIPSPSEIIFPDTKIGQTTTFSQMRIVNNNNAVITVTSIALATGTDFFLDNAPFVPFTIAQGAESAIFGVKFIPTATGSRLDTLTVTVTGGAVNAQTALSGVGSVLQSAFILSGGTQGTLFAFPGSAAPSILLANPNDLNSEELGSFLRMHDFQQMNREKQLLRVRGHYEDLGPATISITATTRRLTKPAQDQIQTTTVSIGSVAADGWIREFMGELDVTGELIQLKVSRAAGSGPVSIINYIPEFEPKGEVIKGT